MARRQLALLAAGWLLGWGCPCPALAVSPQDPPPKIAAFLKQCESSRRGTIAQLEFTLRGLESQRGKSPEVAPRVAKINDELRILRANRAPFVPPLAFPLEAGAIGRLPRLSVHVEQIIGDQEFLARATFPLKVATVRRFAPRGELVEQQLDLLIRGLQTRKLSEGSDVELLEVFEVERKQTLSTVDLRGRGVWVLREFDMKSVEPYFRAANGQK